MMIRIRHVPDNVNRKLMFEAALEGLSLSDYLRREMHALANRPSVPELRSRLASRASLDAGESMASMVRAERDSR